MEIKFDFKGVRKCLVDHDGITLTVLRLIVEEEYRRQGVGTKALDTLKLYAKQKHLRTIRLIAEPETEEVRDDLIRFYRRNGFHFVPGDNETMYCHP